MSETPKDTPRSRIEGWRFARAAAWISCVGAATFLAKGSPVLALVWSVAALSWALAARHEHRKDI